MKNLLASCRNTCWLVAAIIAAIVVIFTAGFTERGLFAALVLGALSLFFLGNIAIWLFCEGSKAAQSTTMGQVGDAAAPSSVEPAAVGGSMTAADAAADPVVSAAETADVTADSAVEPAAETVMSGADETESTSEDASAATGVETSETPEMDENSATSDVDETEGSKTAEKPDATPDMDLDFDKDGVVEGTDEGSKPATLSGPRDGGADDLKQIKGVGPKLEQVCFDLGFYHFDQIAAWTTDEIAWVDANLKGFKGRVSRDAWVDQAKILASGGETEFSKRVEGGSVY